MPSPSENTEVLDRIADRVLWLSTAIVHHANRIRPNPSGLKVGGHQASSASITTIMTALWFGQLTAADRVSVKPHASPVLHAINFLLGELPASELTTLRAFGGLQSYPSRAKDPDPVDYSTGSVGIGATAPIWGALARRYVNSHFGAPLPGRRRRAGRGRLLGSNSGPHGRGSRRSHLDCRLQPAVPGPDHPGQRGGTLRRNVRRRRVAGDHGEVRRIAQRTVRPTGWRRAAPNGSTR